MLWINNSFFFNLYNIHNQKGKSTRNSEIFFIFFSAIQTYIYYCQQHLYWMFLVSYISG
jgi:hypothetical protein